MKSIHIFTILVICLTNNLTKSERSFTVDKGTFLKDGKPFRYISGTMHYFRVPYEYWEKRLLAMKYAGLNAIQTYIEWSSHEPEIGFYNFDDGLDVVKFVKIAQKLDLLVILRLGPFIDAERDMGGLPFWLLRENPNVKLRSLDASFMKHVERWFKKLLPMLVPLLYKNNGPVIMLQVENEYGSYGCDHNYTNYLADLVWILVGDGVVLFTTDGAQENLIKCGKIDRAYATVDFGPGTNPLVAFVMQRMIEPSGPLVNSEYYSGWLDHWGEPHSHYDTNFVVKTLDKILALNASVNIYVFHGGSSFGVTSGSNLDNGNFLPTPTSYDYDAPLNEAGDPTEKYYAIKKLISKYNPNSFPVIKPEPKMRFGPVYLTSIIMKNFESDDNISSGDIYSEYPLSFEKLNQSNGIVAYTTTVNFLPTDPVLLRIPILHDRALVLVDYNYQGTLSRMESIYEIPITANRNSKLTILVESLGRICFGSEINDFKGILSNVTLGSVVLKNWSMALASDDMNQFKRLIKSTAKTENRGYALYYGNFNLQNVSLYDTYLNVNNFRKGYVIINKCFIGRYWPVVGPQKTLYIPATCFNTNSSSNNDIFILDLFGSFPCDKNCFITFDQKPQLDGETPQT